MNGRGYLLDTNAAIALIAGEPALLDLVDTQRVYLSPAVVGELRYGAERSGRPEENHERIDRLLQECPVLPTTSRTAGVYGRLKNELLEKGRSIPNNDQWIAATALEHGLAVVNRGRHFDDVDGFAQATW